MIRLIAGQFVPVKLNAEKEGRAAAKKYGVTGFPTILFVNAQGKEEGRIGGYLPPEPFAARLQEIARAHRELPALEARFKANRGDAATAARLVSLYAERGEAAKASAALTSLQKSDPRNAQKRLVPALLAVASMFITHDSFGQPEHISRAIPLLRQAIPLAADPRDRAYARLSLGVCYIQRQDRKAAAAELKKLIATPDTPADMKERAQRILEAVTGPE